MNECVLFKNITNLYIVVYYFYKHPHETLNLWPGELVSFVNHLLHLLESLSEGITQNYQVDIKGVVASQKYKTI